MPEVSQTLVCRRCDVIPKKILVDDRSDRFVCPACGREENIHIALERAASYLNHGIIKDFQDRQVRSTRRFKHVKYRPGRLPSVPEPDFVFKLSGHG